MSPRLFALTLLLLAPLFTARAEEPRPFPSGQLKIVSRCWAYVSMDGKRVGRTPMQSVPVSAGKHVVELSGNALIEDFRQEIVIRDGETFVLEAPCKRASGEAPKKTEATETRQERDSSSPSQESAPSGHGTLRIVSGHWANVYVDGKQVGRAPMRSLTLPAGEHVLELRGNPRVKEHRQTIVIRAGETLTLKLPAEPVP